MRSRESDLDYILLCLLIAIMKKRLKFRASLYTILQILRLLFLREKVLQVLS